MLNIVRPMLAGAALLAGLVSSAGAADLYQPPVEARPIPAVGAWYIRGHLGMSNQRVDELYNVLFDSTPSLEIRDKNFEAGVIGGGGVGYSFNKWLRADVGAEYRGEAGFHGLDTFVDESGDSRFNNYTAKKSEWLLLANAYADLGEWHGVTPYIGAGVGASRNTIHSFRDAGVAFGVPGDGSTAFPTLAYADSASKWDFAWALHAGLGIRATDNMTIDFGYSYVNLGDGQSGDIIAYDGSNFIDNPMHFRDITSHDFKVGVRYAFGAPVNYSVPDYEPAPVYK